MSLINKMLKDLENNGNNQQANEADIGGVEATGASKSKRRLLIRICILLLLLIILAVVLLYVLGPAKKNTQVSNAAKIKIKASTPVKSSEPKNVVMPVKKPLSIQPDDVVKQPTTATTVKVPNLVEQRPPQQASESKNEIAPSTPVKMLPAAAKIENTVLQSTMLIKPDDEVSTQDTKSKLEVEYAAVLANMKTDSSLSVIKKLTAILQQDPEFKKVRITLAAVLIKYGDNQKAIAILHVGLQRDPAYFKYAELSAHILVQQGNIKAALAVLKKAQPAVLAANTNYAGFMAALYFQQQHYTAAKNIYNELVSVEPNQGKWWAGLGIALQKLGDSQDAYNAFSHAEKLGGLSPTLQAYVDRVMQVGIQ